MVSKTIRAFLFYLVFFFHLYTYNIYTTVKKVKEHLSCALMNTPLDVFYSLSRSTPSLHRHPNVAPTQESFDLLIVYVAIRFRNIYFVPMSSSRETLPKNANVLFTSSVEKKAIEKNCTHTHTPKNSKNRCRAPLHTRPRPYTPTNP